VHVWLQSIFHLGLSRVLALNRVKRRVGTTHYQLGKALRVEPREKRSVSEVGGKRYSWLLGHCGVVAPGRTVHGPSLQ